MKRVLVILAALFFVTSAFAFPPTPPPDSGLTDASNVAITGGTIAGVTNGGIKNVLDQGTADDEIESYASDDIDHGMTDIIGTHIYGFIKKLIAETGGLNIVGLSDVDWPGFTIRGIIGSNTPTLPALALSASKKSGTGDTDIADSEYAFGWYNGLSLIGYVKGNGAWTLSSLEGTPIGATTPAAGTFTDLAGNVAVITDSATGNVTAAQMKGQTHRITGAYTLSLPTAAAGYKAKFRATTATVFSLGVVTGTDVINLNGTALTAGNKVTSDGTINNTIECESDVTGKYECNSLIGLAIDGGA